MSEMSSPSITIVKKKQKSAFGIPLSTIGRKGGRAVSPRREATSPGPGSPQTQARGAALSLIHVSPAGSPVSSPPTSPRGPASPAPPDVEELDEESFREFVSARMSSISSMEAGRRREELERLRQTANAYTQMVLHRETMEEARRKEEDEQKVAAEEAEKERRLQRKKQQMTLSDTPSRISDTDLQEYERALAENKRQLEAAQEEQRQQEELLASADQGAALVEGELVYAEFAEDGMWYLAKVLLVREGGGALVEYVEYGDVAECTAAQIVPRVPGADDAALPAAEAAVSSNATDGAVDEPMAAPAPRVRGDSSWLIRIDSNLGSQFGAGEASKTRRASTVVDLGRALDALERMSRGAVADEERAGGTQPSEDSEMREFLREEMEEAARAAAQKQEGSAPETADSAAVAAVASSKARPRSRKPDESEEGISDSE